MKAHPTLQLTQYLTSSEAFAPDRTSRSLEHSWLPETENTRRPVQRMMTCYGSVRPSPCFSSVCRNQPMDFTHLPHTWNDVPADGPLAGTFTPLRPGPIDP